jgi:glycosyltransferase involved in cell wall biosynthesis
MHVVVVPHGFQEHYSLGFVNGLAQRGVLVDFIRADNMDSSLLHKDVRWCDLGRNTQAGIGRARKLWRFFAYHLRLVNFVAAHRDAVVHVIGLLRTPLVTGVVEGLLFRVLAASYVLTIHNLLPHDRHTAWNTWLFRLIYRIPHLLVVHTRRMKDELVESYGVAADRVVVMQHGLNDIVPDHGKSRAECRTSLGLPHDACMLLIFGRIAPYKGVETLLEALADLEDDFVLVVAGAPVSQAYRRRLEDLIKDHPRRANIVCRFEFVENADIATYFRAADALVMPYRHIDQSGVLFLAFRFGLPVVAFDVGALREYIQDGIGVLVSGGADELARGIRLFRDNRRLNGAEHMPDHAQRFRWERVVEPLLNAYSEKTSGYSRV